MSCNLQCEIHYIAILTYVEIRGCALYVVLATNERISRKVQGMPESKFAIQDCFIQNNLLLKIFYYFIILCAMLQGIFVDWGYPFLLTDLVLKSVANLHSKP